MVNKEKAGKSNFGTHLKRLILSAGYPSVEKFALENGFDRVTIYRIVVKGREPRLTMLLRLTKALEISANTLLDF
jgi:predicted transcriptional regulator